MKGFLICLGVMLKEFFTSKKVLAAIFTALVPLVVHDPTKRAWIMSTGLALIAGLAAADVGKSKALIEAAAAKLSPTVGPALADEAIAALQRAAPAVLAALVADLQRYTAPAPQQPGTTVSITSVMPAPPSAPQSTG